MARGYSNFDIVSSFDLPAHASLPEIPARLCLAMGGKRHDTRQTGQWQAGIRPALALNALISLLGL